MEFTNLPSFDDFNSKLVNLKCLTICQCTDSDVALSNILPAVGQSLQQLNLTMVSLTSLKHFNIGLKKLKLFNCPESDALPHILSTSKLTLNVLEIGGSNVSYLENLTTEMVNLQVIKLFTGLSSFDVGAGSGIYNLLKCSAKSLQELHLEGVDLSIFLNYDINFLKVKMVKLESCVQSTNHGLSHFLSLFAQSLQEINLSYMDLCKDKVDNYPFLPCLKSLQICQVEKLKW